MSTSQIIRLGNGDTVQIRTGAIQGIGPQGPTGPTGLPGQEGPAGPQGERGPIGYVDESALYAKSGTPYQSIPASTNTLVELSGTTLDDFASRQSLTTFKFPIGNYSVFAQATFSRASGTQAGARILRLLMGGDVQWETAQVNIGVGLTTSVTLAGGLNVTNPDAEIALQVWHNDSETLGLNPAQLWISRVGAGVQGEQGEQGIQGPVGATGAQGPQGPAGTIGDHNTTFGALGG